MPNTLAHLGIQTLISKGIDKHADFKWIAVGCILPDLPWITQRIVHTLLPAVNSVDLRLYTIIQASLFFTVFLSGAISAVAKDSAKIFLILAGNSFLHLLLDALQSKWANGVHLLAPFSWQLTGFHLFWPEQLPTHLLTLLGVGTLIFFGIRDGLKEVRFTASRKRIFLAFSLLLFYILAPFLFFQGPLQANNHFMATLLKKNRTGQYMECDRCRYDPVNQTIVTITGEHVKVPGLDIRKKTTLSIRGTFVTPTTIQIKEYHVHHGALRDILSEIGLLSILIIWLVALLKNQYKTLYYHYSTHTDYLQKIHGDNLRDKR